MHCVIIYYYFLGPTPLFPFLGSSSTILMQHICMDIVLWLRAFKAHQHMLTVELYKYASYQKFLNTWSFFYANVANSQLRGAQLYECL